MVLIAAALLPGVAVAVVPGAESTTAVAVCEYRAIGALNPDPLLRGPDRLAGKFCPFGFLPRDYALARLVMDRDTVVNNDGLHGPTEKIGEIALKAGDHPFTLMYFQGSGGKVLGLWYEGPGIQRQAVSPGQLFHK